MNEPSVIYENKDFLVINKPAGLLVHNTVYGQEKTLVDWLKTNYTEVLRVGDDPVNRPGIVHRLDKETSGVMLVARNQETFEYLKNLFKSHLIEKTYLALVSGRVKDKKGVIKKSIGIKKGTIKRSVYSSKMEKPAITEYKVIKFLTINDQDFTLLELKPKTGRTHQLRVHLAFIGYPIVGDKLYGGSKNKLKGLDRQFLHAYAIEFTANKGERMRFEADLPEELKFLLESAQ